MNVDDLDREFASIKAIISSLEPLSPESRSFVLETVFKKLNITQVGAAPAGPSPRNPTEAAPAAHGEPIHIKTFKEQKQPKSINEMVALIAFYLDNVAPAAERKETITPEDVKTYLKIAGYRLPKALRSTLSNTAQSGYIEMVSKGVYKLNAVGYNLIAHTLPRSN